MENSLTYSVQSMRKSSFILETIFSSKYKKLSYFVANLVKWYFNNIRSITFPLCVVSIDSDNKKFYDWLIPFSENTSLETRSMKSVVGTIDEENTDIVQIVDNFTGEIVFDRTQENK